MTSPRRQSSSATCPARCGSGSPCRRSTGRDDSRPRLAAGGRAGRRVRRVTQSPILLWAGAASGLLLVVDAIDEKEAPREAHNRECFSTPSRGQLR